MKKDLSVGEVSKRTGVAVSALHFYEDKGLIQSYRNSSNHRRYKRMILRKISLIKAAQKAGLSLDEIAQQLKTIPNDSSVNTADWERLSKQWRSDLDERIERLLLLRDTLTYCIGCGCLSEKYCELVNQNDHLAERGSGPILLDPKEAASMNVRHEE